MLKFTVTCYYGTYPLRGLFGVSSPRPVEQRVSPQPNEPTENENENVYIEIPLGMIEKLLANPFEAKERTSDLL